MCSGGRRGHAPDRVRADAEVVLLMREPSTDRGEDELQETVAAAVDRA
jgi:hypothetical protein